MAVSRVIEVSFRGSSVALVRVDTAYFYNNGIIFKPTDIDLPTSYQVHWADSPQATSTLETIGTSEGAPIPDDLWDRSRVIYGWIYLHPTENSGVTAYEVRIYKNVRAGLPDGTEPTPAEQSTIDQLISALNTAVEQTAQSEASAQSSAESANADADRAESARDTAGEYANDAESSAASASTSASQASASATASAQSASQSAQIKADVEGMVDDAQSYAESALIASQASVTARDTAQGYAQSASASAQSASGYASNAQTSANTASTKASEASASASTASTKATEAAQSASQASQSATTAESAKTASQTAQGLAESARDSAVQAKTDAESARDTSQTLVDGITGKVEQIDSNTDRIESLEDDRYKPYVVDSASGSIASFPDGADNLPLKSLIVDINPIQDLSHGDPSPENVCPISGWTQVDVEQRGKNLVVTPTSASGTFGWASVPTNQSDIIDAINMLPLGTYTLSYTFTLTARNDTSDSSVGGLIFVGNQYIGASNAISWGNAAIGVSRSVSTTFTITNANIGSYTKVYVYGCGINGIGTTGSTTISGFQIEKGSTATPYSPYTGRSLSISLGQTVYGGHLDVVSGELTVYPYYASYNGETLTGEWISDRDKYVAGTTPTIGAQVVNIGAQGVTVQLSANQINSLYGQNNLWADSGDTEVEYRADTKAYIAKKIAEALASLT